MVLEKIKQFIVGLDKPESTFRTPTQHEVLIEIYGRRFIVQKRTFGQDLADVDAIRQEIAVAELLNAESQHIEQVVRDLYHEYKDQLYSSRYDLDRRMTTVLQRWSAINGKEKHLFKSSISMLETPIAVAGRTFNADKKKLLEIVKYMQEMHGFCVQCMNRTREMLRELQQHA